MALHPLQARANERLDMIVAIANEEGGVTTVELAERFGRKLDSVQCDLRRLAREGRLTSVPQHIPGFQGVPAARYVPYTPPVSPFGRRDSILPFKWTPDNGIPLGQYYGEYGRVLV